MARLNKENYVFFSNPDFEHFKHPLHWDEVRAVARELPGIFRSTLIRMNKGDDWETNLFSFYKRFCSAAAESFGVPIRVIKPVFSLDLARTTNDSMGYMHMVSARRIEIVLGRLEFADVVAAATFLDGELNAVVEASLRKEQSAHLATMLIHWIAVMLHEMYHARQSLQTSQYSIQSGWASYMYNNGRPSLYYRDLGERSAEAAAVRGLLEIERELKRNIHSLPIDLELKLESTITTNQELLTLRSEPFPSGKSSWKGEQFRLARKKKKAFAKRD